MLFKDVLVDESLKKQLIRLVDENRISHAQLFLGKNGTHNFALAIAFAQYLSCEDRHDGDSCGKCNSCLMFQKLQHPDLHLIFPNCTTKDVKKDADSNKLASVFRDFVFAHNYHIDFNDWVSELKSENKEVTINIRDCANIILQNSIRSYQNGYKIYILWMAEKLSHVAAPKLLKTLEEPENKTLFILLAESSDSILPTIISRTQLVKIPPLANETIQQKLIQEFGLSQQTATDVVAISEGNYIKAQQLTQEKDELIQTLGRYACVMRVATMMTRTSDPQQIGYPAIQDLFTEIAKEGKESMKHFLTYVSRMFRNELLLQQKNSTLVKATSEEMKILQDYQSYFTVKNAMALLTECNNAVYHIARNANAGLTLTDWFFKIVGAFANRN